MTTNTVTDCDLDLISAAVDGELSEEEKIRFDTHLAMCADCRAEYLEMWNASKLCAILPEASLPVSLLKDIRGNLVQAKRPVQPSSIGDWFSLHWLFSTPARVSFAFGLGVVLFSLAAIFISNPQQTTPIIGFSLVAEAQDEIAGMDLVFDFDSESVFIQKVSLGAVGHSFLMEEKAEHGILRVSLASAQGIRLTGSESILEIPVQFNEENSKRGEPFQLLEARAYRPDGSRVEVNLKTIPMSPRDIGGKDTAA